MKKLRSFKTILAQVPAVLLVTGYACCAQLPSEGVPAGVSAAMLQLFGNATAFTARADVRVLDNSRNERIRTPVDFAALDGKLRAEIDMTQIRSKELPPAALAGLKQLGVDRVVSVVRPDRKVIYIIYPRAKSYANLPMAKEAATARDFKVAKTVLGKETLDGHLCVKNQVVVKNGTNVLLAATTWNASDLKDFPVQIATKENDLTSILRFQQIRFVRVKASQFEPPAGYTRYRDPQSLMLELSKKVTSSKGR